jgi:hypothetical protein
MQISSLKKLNIHRTTLFSSRGGVFKCEGRICNTRKLRVKSWAAFGRVTSHEKENASVTDAWSCVTQLFTRNLRVLQILPSHLKIPLWS